MWELVNRRYPGYAVYQRRAGVREIPIVVLEPADRRSAGAGAQ
jgi:hypothetical protein